jgi:hypothetical protein
MLLTFSKHWLCLCSSGPGRVPAPLAPYAQPPTVRLLTPGEVIRPTVRAAPLRQQRKLHEPPVVAPPFMADEISGLA